MTKQTNKKGDGRPFIICLTFEDRLSYFSEGVQPKKTLMNLAAN